MNSCVLVGGDYMYCVVLWKDYRRVENDYYNNDLDVVSTLKQTNQKKSLTFCFIATQNVLRSYACDLESTKTTKYKTDW